MIHYPCRRHVSPLQGVGGKTETETDGIRKPATEILESIQYALKYVTVWFLHFVKDISIRYLRENNSFIIPINVNCSPGRYEVLRRTESTR